MSVSFESLDDLVRELCAVRSQVADNFGLEIFGLGGSQAMGTARQDSDIDIDIAVRKLRAINLGGILDAEYWLEDKFERPSDLIFVDFLPDYKRQIFLPNLVAL